MQQSLLGNRHRQGIHSREMVALGLPPGPGSGVLPRASWPMPPSLAHCPVSDPVEAAVLALPTGSGRAGRKHEWRAPARWPWPPFPGPYQAMHQQFPSAAIQGVGPGHCPALSTLAELSSVSRGGQGRWESKEGMLILRGHLPQSRPPTPRLPRSPSLSCS